MTPSPGEKLAEEIKALSPSDRLRVAAGLIERGKYDMAEVLTKMVADELAAYRLLGKVQRS